MCNRLGTIPACDRQTDGQTYILPRHSSRYAYASRGKKRNTAVCLDVKATELSHHSSKKQMPSDELIVSAAQRTQRSICRNNSPNRALTDTSQRPCYTAGQTARKRQPLSSLLYTDIRETHLESGYHSTSSD